MPDAIRSILAASLDRKLVDELLTAHKEAKRNYFLGGLRLTEVEGGRFCEAAFRLLQYRVYGTATLLDQQLDSETLIRNLASLPSRTHPDSVRLHIPRALRLVYDIRNKRNAAHLADGINPNLQDATLVIGVIDWVLAEFIRIYHKVSANEAQQLVEMLVTRACPVIEDFDGFLKVLNPKLKASEHCLVLLYQRGKAGATFAELSNWSRRTMRQNLQRTLAKLIDEKNFIHFNGEYYYITRAGVHEVERYRLITPSCFPA